MKPVVVERLVLLLMLMAYSQRRLLPLESTATNNHLDPSRLC